LPANCTASMGIGEKKKGGIYRSRKQRNVDIFGFRD
jgi:hypothetical protein